MLLDNYKYRYRKYFRSKLYFPNREKPYKNLILESLSENYYIAKIGKNRK